MHAKWIPSEKNLFGAALEKIRISLFYCIRESSLLSSECPSQFTKSLAKDGRVAFAAPDSTECGQGTVRNHAENSSHLATTWQRFGSTLYREESDYERVRKRRRGEERGDGTYMRIYTYAEAVVTPMYTPVHTLCLCYPVSLIDYARVFQGLTDETREDLWDDDTRKTVAR